MLPDVFSIRLVNKLPGEAYGTYSLSYMLPSSYIHACANLMVMFIYMPPKPGEI